MTPLRRYAASPLSGAFGLEGGRREWPGKAGSTAPLE